MAKNKEVQLLLRADPANNIYTPDVSIETNLRATSLYYFIQKLLEILTGW